jgi:hypothetical protein
MLVLDLDRFHQTTNDLTPFGEISPTEAAANLRGEIFQLPQHQPQFLPLGRAILGGRRFLLQACQPFAESRHPRLELALLQQPLFITIDQSADPTLHRLDLLPDLLQVDVRLLVATEATLELPPQRLGILQQLTYVSPDSSVEPIQPDGFELADFRSTQARRIHTHATVIGIRGSVVFREPRDTFPIPPVATRAAHKQSLQEITGALLLLSIMRSVFGELLGDGVKQFRANDGWDRNDDLVFLGSQIARRIIARLLRLTSSWAQPRAALSHTRLTEDRLPFVGRIRQQLAHREYMPILPFGAWDLLLSQSATNCVQRESVPGNPLEDLPHDARLLEHHLILRLSTTGVLADVAVTIRACL